MSKSSAPSRPEAVPEDPRKFAEQLQKTRQEMQGRVCDVNALSEREVINAGRAVGEMVDMLRTLAQEAKALAADKQDPAMESLSQKMDAVFESVLAASQRVLSHLQFQDVVAQALVRTDGWLWVLERIYAEQHKLEVDSVHPPTTIEIGGEKPLVHPDAGEVLMF
jgi:hypothetical protein